MMIDVAKIVEWLGPDGAAAGLRESQLSLHDLVRLATSQRLPMSPKPSRQELANELAYAGVKKLDRNLEMLLAMTKSELVEYLTRKKPTISELMKLLEELGIRPGSDDRKNLLRFVAREISETGLHQRVSRGGAQSN